MSIPPPGYKIVETSERVPGIAPDLLTRFRSRAERRARRRDAERLAPSYRHVVIRERRRWAVVVMQNRLVPVMDEVQQKVDGMEQYGVPREWCEWLTAEFKTLLTEQAELREHKELAFDLWTLVVLPHIDKFDTLTDPFGVFRRAEVLTGEPIHPPVEAEAPESERLEIHHSDACYEAGDCVEPGGCHDLAPLGPLEAAVQDGLAVIEAVEKRGLHVAATGDAYSVYKRIIPLLEAEAPERGERE